MNKPLIRRKWAFEKGRNSSSILFAAVITAAIGALVAGGFRYVGPPSNEKRQTTRATLIPASGGSDFFSGLDEYDPAHTYHINNGGFPFCLSCRRSHYPNRCGGDRFVIDLNTAVLPAIPGFSAEVKTQQYIQEVFPVSGLTALVLPAGKNATDIGFSHRIENDNGKIFSLPQLDAVKVERSMPPSVIRLNGSGLLIRSTVIASCGDQRLDSTAANILKAAGNPAGTYIINWRKNGGKQ